MKATFHSMVLFVRDVAASRQFYEGVLGMQVLMDLGVNVGYAGGLSIWDAEYATQTIYQRPATAGRLGCDNLEMYFETDDLDGLAAQLAEAQIPVAHPIRAQPWGQRVTRVYDPDGYLVELAEPMSAVVLRCRDAGMGADAIAEATFMPPELVREILQGAPA